MSPEIIGIAGGMILAYSGFPQLLKTIRDGHAREVTYGLALSVVGGIGLFATYVWLKHGFDPVLHIEYGISIAIWSVILFYKRFPRRR